MSARMSFIAGRALPLGVFGFLVGVQGQLAFAALGGALRGPVDAAGRLYLVNRVLTLAFFSFLIVIYVIRGRAVARDHNPLAVAAAMVGSFILLFTWMVPGGRRSTAPAVLLASDVLLSVGIIWALYSLAYLRNRFSIVPEARGLVTTGPYRLVRHPVYLGEILSGLGLVLPTLLGPHLAVFAIFLSAQLLRTRFEEGVLQAAYPEYRAYARRTSRLIPFVF